MGHIEAGLWSSMRPVSNMQSNRVAVPESPSSAGDSRLLPRRSGLSPMRILTGQLEEDQTLR